MKKCQLRNRSKNFPEDWAGDPVILLYLKQHNFDYISCYILTEYLESLLIKEISVIFIFSSSTVAYDGRL